jgi:hypothetical protein
MKYTCLGNVYTNSARYEDRQMYYLNFNRGLVCFSPACFDPEVCTVPSACVSCEMLPSLWALKPHAICHALSLSAKMADFSRDLQGVDEEGAQYSVAERLLVGDEEGLPILLCE